MVCVHLNVETIFWILVPLKSRVVDRGHSILPLDTHLPHGHQDHLDDVELLRGVLHRPPEKVAEIQLDKVLEFRIDATPVTKGFDEKIKTLIKPKENTPDAVC